jgi:flavin-dependent dehydrogenase
VLLVDRCEFPRDKACSEYLGPGAADLLESIGVLEELRSESNPLTGTTVIGARGSRLTGRFALASAQRPGAIGLSVTRRVLDAALLRKAMEAGADFLPRAAVEDLVISNGTVLGVTVRAANGDHRTIRARLTIGADGLRSVVARRLGGVTHSAPRRMAFVTHVRGVSGLDHCAEMHVGQGGYVGLNPLGNDLTNVALVVRSDLVGESRGQVDNFFFEILDTFPGVRGRVLRSGLARPVMATGPFASRANQVIANGALLVGDAADFFDPFTGEGVFSALRGAELAARVAGDALQAGGPVFAKSLVTYRRARRQAFLGKWTVERMIGYGMLAPALFDRAVSRLGRRGSMAHTLVGVTADFLPSRRVLNPLFLSRMVI